MFRQTFLFTCKNQVHNLSLAFNCRVTNKRFIIVFRKCGQSAKYSLQSIYWFSVVFQRISVEKSSTNLVADLPNYSLVNQSPFIHISSIDFNIFTCLLISTLYNYNNQQLFYLFVVVFRPFKHSHYCFEFRVPTNKSTVCVFTCFLDNILMPLVFFVFSFEPFSPILIHSLPFSVCTVCYLFVHLKCVKLPKNNLIYIESAKGNVQSKKSQRNS